MSHHNPNVPSDYNPAPEGVAPPKFQAPAHNLDDSQKEAVVELAESSHNAGSGSQYTTTSSAGSGLAGGAVAGSGHGLSGNRDASSTGLSGEGAMSGKDFNNPDRNVKGAHQDTSNIAPHLATESQVHQNEINAVPGVGDAAPKPGKAGPGGTGAGSFPTTGSSGSDFKDQAQQQAKEGESPYPPQRHAGKVGLGPNFSTGDSLTDKIKHALHPSSHKTHKEAVEDYRADEEAQDPLNNSVKGETGLTGNRGQLNPDDSKGMASKRLGEDSMTIGEPGAR